MIDGKLQNFFDGVSHSTSPLRPASLETFDELSGCRAKNRVRPAFGLTYLLGTRNQAHIKLHLNYMLVRDLMVAPT